MFMTLCTGEGLLACFRGLICHVTGRYYNDPDAKDREVAYCRRVDSAPTIEINDEGISWVVLGSQNFAANLPTAACSDSEDGSTIDDPVINYAAVDTSQPGNYDAAGLTVEKSRKVALHPLNLLYIYSSTCSTLDGRGDLYMHGLRWPIRNGDPNGHC